MCAFNRRQAKINSALSKSMLKSDYIYTMRTFAMADSEEVHANRTRTKHPIDHISPFIPWATSTVAILNAELRLRYYACERRYWICALLNLCAAL